MMTDQLAIIGSILGIIIFLASSLGFGIKGAHEWHLHKDAINREERINLKRGRTQCFIGIACFFLSLLFVGILVRAAKNGAFTNPDEDTTTSPVTDIPVLVEPVAGEGNIFISNLPCSGATYSGYVDSKTRLPNGKGKMKYLNGNVYNGEWIQGVQQGSGLMQYYNEDVYDGKWQDGERHGDGIYTWKDERQYKGAYKNDLRDGEGIFAGWVDLTYGWKGTYFGASKDDQFEGYGKFVFDNGDAFEGIFKSDRFWNGLYVRKDGLRQKIVDGKPKE